MDGHELGQVTLTLQKPEGFRANVVYATLGVTFLLAISGQFGTLTFIIDKF